VKDSSEETAPRQTFVREERIAKRSDFTRTYEGGRKQFGRYVVVFALDTERGLCRLGITATRKVGKAHLRNRMKRWVRECYRLHREKLGLDRRSIDFVVNIKPSAGDALYANFCADLVRSLQRSAERSPQSSGR
jgi:ribonuclease P protein component